MHGQPAASAERALLLFEPQALCGCPMVRPPPRSRGSASPRTQIRQKLTLFERIFCRRYLGNFDGSAGGSRYKLLKIFIIITHSWIWHASSIRNSSQQPATYSILKGEKDYGPQNRRGVLSSSVSSSDTSRHQPGSDWEMVLAILKRR